MVIDVEKTDVLEKVREVTGGKGVDVSIDCTAGAGQKAFFTGLRALKGKAGTLVVQGATLAPLARALKLQGHADTQEESVARIAAMFGWDTHLGHLSGGGTAL